MTTRLAAFFALVVAVGCSESPPPGPAALRSLDATKLTVHQIEPRSQGNDATGLHGWTAVRSKMIDDESLRNHVLDILTRAGTYTAMGNKCFDPGMGFTASDEAGKTIVVLICLECNWAYFYGTDADGPNPALSAKGVSELAQVFKDIFGQPQPSACIEGKVVEP